MQESKYTNTEGVDGSHYKRRPSEREKQQRIEYVKLLCEVTGFPFERVYAIIPSVAARSSAATKH